MLAFLLGAVVGLLIGWYFPAPAFVADLLAKFKK
jgi:hypothetical protein